MNWVRTPVYKTESSVYRRESAPFVVALEVAGHGYKVLIYENTKCEGKCFFFGTQNALSLYLYVNM